MYTQRTEKKYIVDKEIMVEILNRLPACDKHEEYTVSNIYYDTDDYELIRKSIEKPLYKEKLRMRSYGSNKTPFLEIKKKFDGIVYKSRSKMPLKENSQFNREIKSLMGRYELSPKIFLAYDRVASEIKDLRISFDTKVRFREDYLDFHSGDWGVEILPFNKVLMEAKTTTAFPMWFSKMLSNMGVYPISFSKYGNCYKNYIWKGGVISA